MLKDIIEATPLEGYQVRLRFEDGWWANLISQPSCGLRECSPPSKTSIASENFVCTPNWAPSIGRTGPTSIQLYCMLA